jgi:hypothetical protein
VVPLVALVLVPNWQHLLSLLAGGSGSGSGH